MADVIIMGGGPAGVSAALYTARAGLNTLILTGGGGALSKSGSIGNYYGFAQPVPGKDLLKNGVEQAKNAGAQVRMEEAVGISWDGEFSVMLAEETLRAPFVVLATGASRKAPAIPGLTEFEGRGVSYCAVCDAFFYRKKEVAVLGSGEYALHEAMELLPVAAKVTVLTNGEKPSAKFPPEIDVVTEKIEALKGEDSLKSVLLQGGKELPAAGVFVAVGVAGSVDLARKIGAETRGTAILTDANRMTNIPGLYAAGDCTGGMYQIAKAVYDGALAGTSVVKEFRASKAKEK